MRLLLTSFLLALTAVVTPGVAGAAPTAMPPGIADLDGDHISDALSVRIAESDPSESIDVVVTWDGRPDEAAARAAAGPFEITRRFTIIDGFAATVRASQVRGLANVPGVFRIEQDFQVTTTVDDAATAIGSDAARAEYGLDGSGVLACVLDTGADPQHEQLDGDKITHWMDFVGSSTTPQDPHGHGTHVAATLAGDGSGGSPDAQRLAGIAPGAALAIGRVLDANGSGSESGIIAGIEWCVAVGAHLGSMSLGTSTPSDGNDALSRAVDAAVTDHGLAMIVAAGNSGDDLTTIGSPGAARQALTIGASVPTADGLRLAYFSSRGPTLDGRVKPDVVAPGYAIYSADAGTAAGYVAMSGTSMATPVAAGAVALALQGNPSLVPAQLKSMLTGTAHDLGAPGPDVDWGAGLIDAHAFIASAGGDSRTTVLPTHSNVQGQVGNSGTWRHTFELTAEDLDGPIAATLLVDGASECALELLPGWCFAWEWSPDLDARLLAPNGSEVSLSTCPAGVWCGTAGHQETLFVADPTMAGTYTIEVWPFAGEGGTFTIDLFTGAPAPPEPVGSPPNAVDDTGFELDEDTSLEVAAPGVLANDTDPDLDPLTVSGFTQPAHGAVSVESDGGFTYTPDADWFGSDSFDYTASDGTGGSATATVTVSVVPVNDAPVADAGASQTVTDADGDGFADVTLDGSGSFDIDGTITAWTWAEGATVHAATATPIITLATGTHTITLTVTDDLGAADSDTMTVTVEPFNGSGPTVHVADLDGGFRTHGRGQWTALAWITVHDDGHQTVSGATVTLTFGTAETVTCQTNGAGTCRVDSQKLPASTSSVTFVVESIEYPGSAYDETANHDPDGDSDGTSLTVSLA